MLCLCYSFMDFVDLDGVDRNLTFRLSLSIHPCHRRVLQMNSTLALSVDEVAALDNLIAYLLAAPVAARGSSRAKLGESESAVALKLLQWPDTHKFPGESFLYSIRLLLQSPSCREHSTDRAYLIRFIQASISFDCYPSIHPFPSRFLYCFTLHKRHQARQRNWRRIRCSHTDRSPICLFRWPERPWSRMKLLRYVCTIFHWLASQATLILIICICLLVDN